MGSRFAQMSVVGYLAIVLGIVGGLSSARTWATRELGTDVAQADWDEWRESVRRQPTNAPVARKVPKSDEPPALKLLRDYFGVSLAMCLLLGSILYGTLLIALKGVLAPPASTK